MKFEREFLIRLGAIYLACRYKVMGGKLAGYHLAKSDLAYDLLGMLDYAAEMRLICQQRLAPIQPEGRRSVPAPSE